MEKSKLKHLPEYQGLNASSDSELRIVERAEVEFNDGAKYLIYVIGLRNYHNKEWDIVHSISSKDESEHKGLKFCPLEGLVSYTVLSKDISKVIK